MHSNSSEKALKQLRWRELFEGVGVTAIVASLIFVGYQIQQDHDIARSQLGSETFAMLGQIYEARSGPELSEIYFKMLDSPEELSTVEMLRVNNYLQSVTQLFFRECFLMRRNVFIECEDLIRSHVPLFFGNAYAKKWWEGSMMKRYLPEWVDEEISRVDPQAEIERIEEIRSAL